MKTLFGFLIVSFALTSCYDNSEYRGDFRDRMTGRYDVEEYSDTYDEYVYYSMYVSKDHNSRDVIFMDDFYAENVQIYAYVSNDHIDIPFQVVNGFEIEGHGSYYSGDLHLNYSVRDRYSNAFTDYCQTVAYD